MDFRTKLMQSYFNFIYNPVYDFATAQLGLYKEMQNRCLDKFEFREGDKVLCVGVGTGNEIINILKRNRKVSIVGVDYSEAALRKVGKKALSLGVTVEVLIMDVRELKFPTGSFDKAICLHVTDFLDDGDKATTDIIRVLKHGGEFVITYPSEKDGSQLGINLVKDSFRKNMSSGNGLKGVSRFLAQILAGTAYLPLLLRTKKRKYSNEELQNMFAKLVNGSLSIDSYPMYQDFIVYGRK